MKYAFTYLVCICCLCGQEENADARTNLDHGRYHELYSGDMKKATTFYTAVLKQKGTTDDVQVRALLGLARCLRKQGEVKQSAELMTKALKSHPKIATKVLAEGFEDQEWRNPFEAESRRYENAVDKTRSKLNTIVLPKVKFVNEDMETVVKYLKEQSKKRDPEGKGIHFVMIRQDKPKVTLDLENLPLRLAVHWLCKQTNSYCKIEGGQVVLMDPIFAGDGLELRFVPIDPEVWKTRIDLDNAKTRDAAFKAYFQRMGVPFPDPDAPDGRGLSYDAGTNQLVVRNRGDFPYLIEELVKGLNTRPPQVEWSATVWEVDWNEGENALKHADVALAILELPADKRTCLGALTFTAKSGTTAVADENARSHIFNKALQVHHRFSVTGKTGHGRKTFTAALDWSYSAWDPAKIATTDADKAKRLPTWSAAVKKTVALTDGKALAIRLSPPSSKPRHGTIYLIVKGTLVDFAGQPIHDQAPH